MRESLAFAGATLSALVAATALILIAFGEPPIPMLRMFAFAVFGLVFCLLATDDERPE